MRKALLVVGAGVALLPLVLLPISEAGDGPSFLLLMDIAAVGLLAAGVIVSRKLPEGSVGLVSGLACGALVGACLVGPLRTARSDQHHHRGAEPELADLVARRDD